MVRLAVLLMTTNFFLVNAMTTFSSNEVSRGGTSSPCSQRPLILCRKAQQLQAQLRRLISTTPLSDKLRHFKSVLQKTTDPKERDALQHYVAALETTVQVAAEVDKARDKYEGALKNGSGKEILDQKGEYKMAADKLTAAREALKREETIIRTFWQRKYHTVCKSLNYIWYAINTVYKVTRGYSNMALLISLGLPLVHWISRASTKPVQVTTSTRIKEAAVGHSSTAIVAFSGLHFHLALGICCVALVLALTFGALYFVCKCKSAKAGRGE